MLVCESITALLKRPRGMQEALVIVLSVWIGSVTMLIGSMAVTMYNTSNWNDTLHGVMELGSNVSFRTATVYLQKTIRSCNKSVPCTQPPTGSPPQNKTHWNPHRLIEIPHPPCQALEFWTPVYGHNSRAWRWNFEPLFTVIYCAVVFTLWDIKYGTWATYNA